MDSIKRKQVNPIHLIAAHALRQLGEMSVLMRQGRNELQFCYQPEMKTS